MLGLGALRYIMLKNDVGHWTDMFIVLVVRIHLFSKKKKNYTQIRLSS